MEQPAEDKRYIKGLAKGIIEELVRADLTMHEMQVEQWARIARHRPEGDDIPRDVLRGFGRHQYLSLKEVDLTLHVKPRPAAGFFNRLKLGFQVMFGRSLLRKQEPFEYDLCNPNDKGAEKMILRIQRLGDGELKTSYHAAEENSS